MFRSMKSPLTISFFPIFFFNFCFWYFSTKLLVSGSVTFSGKVEAELQEREKPTWCWSQISSQTLHNRRNLHFVAPKFLSRVTLLFQKSWWLNKKKPKSGLDSHVSNLDTTTGYFDCQGSFSFFFQNFICFIILQQLKQFYYIVSFLLLATENQAHGTKYLKGTHFCKVN